MNQLKVERLKLLVLLDKIKLALLLILMKVNKDVLH
jgi:hypothetical protein